MTQIKKALLFSLMNKYIVIALQIISMMILSRILSPDDYGVFTIAIVFITLANILREFGVGSYIIKEKDLTNEKIGSAFSLLLIASTFTALLLFLSAQYIATFYNDQRLYLMLQFLSLNILITPLGAIVESLLRRELKFDGIMYASTLSQVVSITVMIILAYNGEKELTMVYGAIIATIFKAGIIQFFRPKDIPKLPGYGKIKEIFAYSKFASTSSLFSQGGHFASEMTVGKFYTMADVGALNRASNTASFFNQLVTSGIGPVIAPFISQINHNEDSIAPKIIKFQQIFLILALPFYLLLALLAEPVVIIMYGEQWIIVGTYLFYCSIGRMIVSLTQLYDPILLGLGKAKDIMKIQVFINIVRIISVLISVQYGIIYLVITEALLITLIRTICYSYTFLKHVNMSFIEMISCWYTPLKTAFLVSLVPILCNILLEEQWWRNYFILLCACALSLILWLILVWNQPLGLEIKNHIKR